jgi:hypothetical protein
VDFLSTASTSSFWFRKFAFLVIYSSFWKPSFGTSFEEREARSRKIHSPEKIRRENRQAGVGEEGATTHQGVGFLLPVLV